MNSSSRKRQRSRRNSFMYWWPVTARVMGVGIALGHVAYTTIVGQPADASVLGFCGALAVLPNVVGGGQQ